MNTEILMEERAYASRALGDSEQRYKRLLASVSDYVYMVTIEHGRAVATSHSPGCEAVTGYAPGELDADLSLWYRMIHEQDRPAVLAQAEQILSGQRPPPLEHRIIHKDRRIRWIRNTPVPRTDGGGKLLAYDGLVSDITERKVAEAQLRHAYSELARNQQSLSAALRQLKAAHSELQSTQLQLIQSAKLESIGTLAASVAHEVKNPLQTIVMGLDYLERDLPGRDENIALVLGDLRDAVGRANRIVQELLHYSAAAVFEMKEEDLNALVERSLWLINCEVVASQTRVVRSLGADLPRVSIDRVKMEQVCINLLMNALQAMSQGGVLTVTTRAAWFGEDANLSGPAFSQFNHGERLVIVEVQDTGPGIAEPDLQKIFDPFFTTKPRGAGTGLGLSVGKKIVDLHGGVIDVRNVSAGGVLATLVLRVEQGKRRC